MGRSKKPGAPGKTTIPPEVVFSVTTRLLAVFHESGFDTDYYLFVVPQQCYLYVETREMPTGCSLPVPPITKGSTTHKPLGRLKYVGTTEDWVCQPYSWADEFWNDQGTERGCPEDLMSGMLLKLA